MSKEKCFFLEDKLISDNFVLLKKIYTKDGKAFSFFGHGYFGSKTWTSIVSLNPPIGLQENE